MKKDRISIGNRLKSARMKKGRTFDDIYKDIKVHPNILDSLEKDNIDPGLSEIYVRAFLRKYAAYLGLESDKMLSELTPKDELQDELAREDIISLTTENRTPIIIKQKFIKSLLPLAFGAGLVLVLSIVFYTGSKIVKLFKRPPRVITIASSKTAPVKPGLLVPANQALILSVEAKDNAWLRVKSDGNVIFEHTLAKGSIENWEARDELELWVGRAEALSFTLNGKALDSPGRGRIKKIIIDHYGLKVEKK